MLGKGNAVSNSDQSDAFWKSVWSSNAPPKVLASVWKALHGRIPCKVELEKRGVLSLSNLCYPFCGRFEESINHLFCHCQAIWNL
ncbi:hypothetical protein V6N13_138368 [Hibiscus sabdariffa]